MKSFDRTGSVQLSDETFPRVLVGRVGKPALGKQFALSFENQPNHDFQMHNNYITSNRSHYTMLVA